MSLSASTSNFDNVTLLKGASDDVDEKDWERFHNDASVWSLQLTREGGSRGRKGVNQTVEMAAARREDSSVLLPSDVVDALGLVRHHLPRHPRRRRRREGVPSPLVRSPPAFPQPPRPPTALPKLTVLVVKAPHLPRDARRRAPQPLQVGLDRGRRLHGVGQVPASATVVRLNGQPYMPRRVWDVNITVARWQLLTSRR